MPTGDPSEDGDEGHEPAREAKRQSVRSVLTSVSFVVKVVALLALGFNALSLLRYAVHDLWYVGLGMLILVVLGFVLLLSDLRSSL